MTGRPRSCSCDECPKCLHRKAEAARWAALSPEQRAAAIARRDRAKVAAWAAKRERSRTVENAAQRRHRQRHPERERARQMVYRAIAAGRLVRGVCERAGADCRGLIEAHHDDYSRPLVVRWLCRFHHLALHREEAERARTQAA